MVGCGPGPPRPARCSRRIGARLQEAPQVGRRQPRAAPASARVRRSEASAGSATAASPARRPPAPRTHARLRPSDQVWPSESRERRRPSGDPISSSGRQPVHVVTTSPTDDSFCEQASSWSGSLDPAAQGGLRPRVWTVTTGSAHRRDSGGRRRSCMSYSDHRSAAVSTRSTMEPLWLRSARSVTPVGEATGTSSSMMVPQTRRRERDDMATHAPADGAGARCADTGRHRLVRLGRVRGHHAWSCSGSSTRSPAWSRLFEEDYFVVGAAGSSSSADYTAWGWTHLIIGVLVAGAGAALINGATWARVVAVVLASLSAIVNLAFLSAYPAVVRHHDHPRHPRHLRRHRPRRPRLVDGVLIGWPRTNATSSASTIRRGRGQAPPPRGRPREDKPFRIQVAGERVRVPRRAQFSIEHERGDDEEEIEFQLTWSLAVTTDDDVRGTAPDAASHPPRVSHAERLLDRWRPGARLSSPP